ncbi:hypothetical protein GWI33_013465 [Rhynchophorus ferrugineus]|uniref:C-type lectin domain-containing protein n=1 Tax=Rhynchophorus ferrugineus TaxID=354439 RepID=A0A834I4K0_RHYFE|nr:hypothetical protein GWI33_013465 [Rhynchophorus ferrugineus]
MANFATVATIISFVLLNTLTVVSSCNTTKFILSTEKETFFDAYRKCLQIGFKPLEIVLEEDAKCVGDKLRNHTINHWWIFATNLGDYVNYYWLHTGKPLIYTQFESEQPNNPRNENCLVMYSKASPNPVWHDFPCDSKFRYICKY